MVQASPSLVPDGFIYLRATPDICMGRMKRRSRQEEVGVQMEYLQGLHQKHEDWLRFPPASAAREWCNPSGETLVETLRRAQHSLSVRAVPEPRAIQGKVCVTCGFQLSFAGAHISVSSHLSRCTPLACICLGLFGAFTSWHHGPCVLASEQERFSVIRKMLSCDHKA